MDIFLFLSPIPYYEVHITPYINYVSLNCRNFRIICNSIISLLWYAFTIISLGLIAKSNACLSHAPELAVYQI